MVIAFFTCLINNLSRKLNYCKNIDEVIDVFVDNICEFHSLVKFIHDSCICDLGNCQVRFLCDSLGEYFENNVRRSNHLLRRKSILLSVLYPAGFRDCVFILKRAIVTILPSS